MTPTTFSSLAGAAVLTLCLGPALGGCGGLGRLEQPPPLFGAKAKADYYAQRNARAEAVAQANAQQRDATGTAESTLGDTETQPANTAPPAAAAPAPAANTTGDSDPNANDAPLTTRDVQDPDQKMTSPRDSPVPGAPNSMGPTPSVTPPYR